MQILLVEDNPADAELVREAFQEAAIPNEIQHVSDGEQAMSYLRAEGGFSVRARPDVILLDLNLPRMDGREVLRAVKSDPELHLIPVVVLTTSSADTDVSLAYRNHANAYIKKPVDFNDFINVIKSFESFWLSAAILPPQNGGSDQTRSETPVTR
ncbi:MAG: response regulator [Actinobacteria bacterium]|nr:response regulator [Actinomycetota bacterium]